MPKFIRAMSSHSLLTDVAVRLLSPWVTVFMVHRLVDDALGVSGTEPAYLRRCLKHLKDSNYQFISIDDAIAQAAAGSLTAKKWVAFTVDDGFHDQVATASRIFAEFECPATYFLVTGLLDGQVWPWDYQLMHVARHAPARTIEIDVAGTTHRIAMGQAETKNTLMKLGRQCPSAEVYRVTAEIAERAGVKLPAIPPAEMQPACWSDVREAEGRGMRFGAHSVSHYILSRLDDQLLRTEIEDSVNRVRNECQNPSEIFCYPSGKISEFDIRAIDVVRNLGLKGALSAEPGYLEPRQLRRHAHYRYAIPRLPLPNDFDDFKLYLSWAQKQRENLSKSPLDIFLD